MTVEREINAFSLGKIRVTYSEYAHDAADNDIILYDDYKISIHLTGGLFGVVNNKIVGGEHGDVLLFAPEEIHFGRFTLSASYRFINIYLSPDFYEALVREHPASEMLFAADRDGRINCIRGSYEEKVRIIELSESLIPLLRSNGVADEMRIFSVVLSILLICAELYPKESTLPATTVGSPYVQRAIEYVIAHYDERITLYEISENVGCSTVYLSRLFRRYMGKTVHGYLTEYRIRKAMGYLGAGCSVTEACYSAGFGDCSSFIDTFRKLTGLTPHQYKKQREQE